MVSAAAAAVGISEIGIQNLTQVLAHESQPNVVWLQGQNCTGCTIAAINNRLRLEVSTAKQSALGIETHTTDDYGNALSDPLPPPILDSLGMDLSGNKLQLEPDNQTTIDDVVLDIIDLEYQPNIFGASGNLAVEVWERDWSDGMILVVEGAVPSNATKYCTIGKDRGNNHFGQGADAELYLGDLIDHLTGGTHNCLATIALGTCAAFGGVPSMSNVVLPEWDLSDTARYTGAGPVSTYSNVPTVNLPGCPANPEWFILTVVSALIDIEKGELDAANWEIWKQRDAYNRPKRVLIGVDLGGDIGDSGVPLYEEKVHHRCPRYQKYLSGEFQTSLGENNEKCLLYVGCKGPLTSANCPLCGWNDSVSYHEPLNDQERGAWTSTGTSVGTVNQGSARFCISGNFPCIGCTEKGFPDAFTPIVGGYNT
jgi:Ni,Fe-hydrogenase I small subunit